MAIIIKANRAITAPLAGTPLAPLPAITSDTFSGANIDGLSGRMSDALIAGTPKTWIAETAALAISNGKLVRGTNTTGTWFNGFDMGTVADYDMSIDVNVLPGGATFMDARRASFAVSPGPAGYRVQIAPTGVCLYKRFGVAHTAISSEFPIAAGNNIKLSVKGSTVKLYVNNVEKASVTDTDITAPGYCGIAGSSGTSAFMFDNLLITNN